VQKQQIPISSIVLVNVYWPKPGFSSGTAILYKIYFWKSEWVLFNANSAIFQLYHGKGPTQGLVLIWFSDFKGEDLNVKVYDVPQTDGRWTQSDVKSSHGLWQGGLN
jgi:hypothetical protein